MVLNVVATILGGAPPSSGDTNDEVAEYFVDKADSLKVAALLGGLSLIALSWWFGSLWRRMSKAENGNHRLSVVALIGFTGSGALFAASQAPVSAIAFRVDELSPDAIRLFWVLSTVLLSMAAFFITVHLAAVNALALRTGMLPKWATIVGLVSAVAFLFGGFGVMTDADAILLFGFIGFIMWSVWLVATSVHMWRTADAA